MKVSIKRLDHYGIVAGVIKDIGLVELIDEQIKTDSREILTAGEVVAGLVINGLGFASRPLMLAPQFFESKTVDRWIGEGVKPEHFNRHKIGRVLDALHAFGCEKLFSMTSSVICASERIETKFAHADTTSYSLHGEYSEGVDENGNPIEERVTITHGYAKNKRFDLKQVIQELVTSNDCGIPLMTKTLSGNASDSLILRERATALMDEFSKSGPRCLVADSKLYAEATADVLNNINFITRVPSTIKLEKEYTDRAVDASDNWIVLSDTYKVQEFKVSLYGIEDQRWFVFHSQEASKRSKISLDKAIKKEEETLIAELSFLRKTKFGCEADARKVLAERTKKLRYHDLSKIIVSTIKVDKEMADSQKSKKCDYAYQIDASFEINQKKCDKVLNENSCFTLATTMHPDQLSAKEALDNYKDQDYTEKGFAFLKDKEFFTSSLNLKKTGRIEAVLMIMVLSLLVYSLAQRRLRMALAQNDETIPNQVNKPTKKPTMRWVFQLFEGVNLVSITVGGATQNLIEGLNEVRQKIINLLGKNVLEMYSLSP